MFDFSDLVQEEHERDNDFAGLQTKGPLVAPDGVATSIDLAGEDYFDGDKGKCPLTH